MKHRIQADTSYGHSYHTVAECIRENPEVGMNLIICADSVCTGCVHLKNGICTDKIKKPGFRLKHNYNKYLDRKIMKKLDLNEYEVKMPVELCRIAWKYLNNILSIYDLNDPDHTAKRKELVTKGLHYYKTLHHFPIDLI